MIEKKKKRESKDEKQNWYFGLTRVEEEMKKKKDVKGKYKKMGYILLREKRGGKVCKEKKTIYKLGR